MHCLFCRCAAEHSRRHGLWSADDFDSVYHTAVDRHAALAHAFHPASTTEFYLPRSAVDPLERLVAMIFPFVDDVSRGQVNEVTITSTMSSFILFYVVDTQIFSLLFCSFGECGSMIWAMLPYQRGTCMHSLRRPRSPFCKTWLLSGTCQALTSSRGSLVWKGYFIHPISRHLGPKSLLGTESIKE